MKKGTIGFQSDYEKPQILLIRCEQDVLAISGSTDFNLEKDNDGIDKELGW